jgi:hypothetical protein
VCSHLRSLTGEPGVTFANPTPLPEINSFSVDVVNPPIPQAVRRWSGSGFRGSPLWVLQDASANLALKDPLLRVISSLISDGVVDLSSFQSRTSVGIDLNILSFTEFLLFLVGCVARDWASPIGTLDLSQNKLRAKSFGHFERFLLFLSDLSVIVLARNEFSSFPGFQSRPGLVLAFEVRAGESVDEPPGWNDPPWIAKPAQSPNAPPGWDAPYVCPVGVEKEAMEEEEPPVVAYGAPYGGLERIGGPPGWFNGAPKVGRS